MADGKMPARVGGGLVAARACAGARPDAMPVAERFVSVNGEGPRAGRLAAFVRFAGCNLACSYCDTAWANDPSCPCEPLPVDDVAAFVLDSGAPFATLTGGEPLLQPLLLDLVRALLAREDGPFVEIETNGAVDVAPVANLRRGLGGSAADRLGLTVDYKLPGSGMEDAMLPGNFEALGRADAVKFVAGSRADLERARQVIERHGLCDRCGVYLSPVFGRLDLADIVEFMKEKDLAGAAVQLQLHKIIWPRCEKGV